MVLRRLRQRTGRLDLQCAGTSATIATGGDRATRRAEIAEVGTRLFGARPRHPENVIDETLERVAQVPFRPQWTRYPTPSKCRRLPPIALLLPAIRSPPGRNKPSVSPQKTAVWCGAPRFPLPTG